MFCAWLSPAVRVEVRPAADRPIKASMSVLILLVMVFIYCVFFMMVYQIDFNSWIRHLLSVALPPVTSMLIDLSLLGLIIRGE